MSDYDDDEPPNGSEEGSDDPYELCQGCGAHFCDEHDEECPFSGDDEDDED